MADAAAAELSAIGHLKMGSYRGDRDRFAVYERRQGSIAQYCCEVVNMEPSALPTACRGWSTSRFLGR